MSRTLIDLDDIDTEWAKTQYPTEFHLRLYSGPDAVTFNAPTTGQIAAMVAALADTLADEGIDVPGWRQEREL